MKYHNWQARHPHFSLVDNTKAKKLAASYITNGMTVLDIGSGDCDFFDFLKHQGLSCHFHTYDVEAESLAIAEKKGYIPHTTLEMKERFDVVTMFEVIEHLTMDERVQYAAILTTLIKPGGYLILSFPHIKSYLSVVNYFDNQDHKIPYVKVFGLTYLFEQFTQEKVMYFTPWVNPLKILLSLVTALSFTGIYNNVCVVLKKKL